MGEAYCKQLISEARDEKGKWKQIGSRANHYWDNWMAINSLADWLGVRTRPKPEPRREDVELEGFATVPADSSY